MADRTSKEKVIALTEEVLANLKRIPEEVMDSIQAEVYDKLSDVNEMLGGTLFEIGELLTKTTR